jgi:6-pyruvoyl-tetrahydropterin synthase-like protein
MADSASSNQEDTCTGGPLLGQPLLAVVATAFAVVLPWLFFGIPSGHDFEFHMNSWMEVLSQWRQGIVYPRWAALAHHGYGEPRFVFYPPASWILGASLGALLPWKLVPAVYVWISLTLSGCSMFLAARNWMSRQHAIFASALYAANPYYILIVYWRSAFAELLAGALLPLLVLYVLRLDERGWRAVIPLGIVVAGACLTNAPSSVMVNYSVALLALASALFQRSRRVTLYVLSAGLLGMALAAFYILPATYEQGWVNIAQVLAPGVRPQDNFLFTRLNDPDHNRFNLLVSLIASTEIAALAFLAFSLRKQRSRLSQCGWTFLGWVGAIVLLMFSFSTALWEHLPLLRFVQLPWRWLLCLNVAFALSVPLAWRHWPTRVMTGLVMLAVLVLAGYKIQPPWWDNAQAIASMVNQHQSGRGYEGTDEYLPAGADPYDAPRDWPRVAWNGGGTSRIDVKNWAPESKLFTAQPVQPSTLVLRLFNYPAWHVEVNGRAVETQTQDDTGQMMVPMQAGDNRVQVTFMRTWDRTVGWAVSLTSVVVLLSWILKRRLVGTQS